jgi:hypothetical protein
MLLLMRWQGVPRIARKKEDIAHIRALIAYEREQANARAFRSTTSSGTSDSTAACTSSSSSHAPRNASLHARTPHATCAQPSSAGSSKDKSFNQHMVSSHDDMYLRLLSQAEKSVCSEIDAANDAATSGASPPAPPTEDKNLTADQRAYLYARITGDSDKRVGAVRATSDVSWDQLMEAVRRKVDRMARKGRINVPMLKWDRSLGPEEVSCLQKAGRMCVYYQPKHWFVDIASSLVRLIISSVIIFITSDAYVQFAVLLTLLFLIFMLSIEYKPYIFFVLNLQQMYHAFALFTIVLYGLLQYQLTSSPGPNGPLQIFSAGSPVSIIVLIVCISAPFAPAAFAIILHIIHGDYAADAERHSYLARYGNESLQQPSTGNAAVPGPRHVAHRQGQPPAAGEVTGGCVTPQDESHAAQEQEETQKRGRVHAYASIPENAQATWVAANSDVKDRMLREFYIEANVPGSMVPDLGLVAVSDDGNDKAAGAHHAPAQASTEHPNLHGDGVRGPGDGARAQPQDATSQDQTNRPANRLYPDLAPLAHAPQEPASHGPCAPQRDDTHHAHARSLDAPQPDFAPPIAGAPQAGFLEGPEGLSKRPPARLRPLPETFQRIKEPFA